MVMVVTTAPIKVAWEKLPDDFVLPDEPVDNINQSALAAALTESLELAGKLAPSSLTTTNYGICATLNNKVVVKAPDWSYIPTIRVPRDEVQRSYIPRLQGDLPAIVMEFLSETEGGEYSIKPTYPPGKWFFYERILKVANYVIFEPEKGTLEVYCIGDADQYYLQESNELGRYWIPELSLFLGIWEGSRGNWNGYWLRWWTEPGDLLLWGSELAAQAQEAKEAAEVRAAKLAAQLRAAGIEPEA